MAVENKAKQSKFLSNGLQLICDVKLASLIGDKVSPVFLQHLIAVIKDEAKSFGKDVFQDGRRWIYNTYPQWKARLGKIYSVSTIRRTVYKLERMGILLSCQPDKKAGNNRKYYTVDFEAFERFKQGNCEHMLTPPSAQMDSTLTKNTSISSITSGEEVSKKPVKQPYTKPPRKETISKPEIKESKLTEANQVIYKLIEVYQKQIGEKVVLSKRLSQWLMAAFQKLGSCLKKWENFCKRIASSDWLMGRITNGFKASLSWLLRFEVMDHVLAGGYKCKEPYEETPIPTQEDENEIIKQIENSELSSEEQSVKKTLLKTFGVARFKSCFAQAKIKVEQGNVFILVRGLFYRDQIDTASIWGKIMALYPNAVLGVES